MSLFRRNQAKKNAIAKLGAWPLRLREFGLVDDFELTPKEHPEVFVIRSGKVVLTTEDPDAGGKAVPEGSVIIFRPGDRAQFTNVSTLSMSGIRFLPEWLSRDADAFLNGPNARALWASMLFFDTDPQAQQNAAEVFHLDEAPFAAVLSDLAVLFEQAQVGRSWSEVANDALSRHTLIKVLLQLADAYGVYWRGEQQLDWPDDLAAAVELLERTAARGERLNQRQAAAEAGTTETTFTKCLEFGTGSDPMRYLERRRAQFAARMLLLSAGKTRDEDIIQRAGFRNQTNFDEAMKDTFGRSAAAYRAEFCGSG